MEVTGNIEGEFNTAGNREHLNGGVNPIEVHMATFDSIRNSSNEFPFNIDDLRSSAEEVDFNPQTDHIISPVNDKNKFTTGLANCTSVVVMGIEKGTGNNISFETHQSDPPSDDTHPFLVELTKNLDEIKGHCVEGTVDAVIAGGSAAHPVREEAYKKTIAMLDRTIRATLGFEPLVAVGPKIDVTNDELVYCDTQNRAIYVIRSQYNGDTVREGYRPSDLDKVSVNWSKERKDYRASTSPRE
jgi:hypothetical protein